MKDYFLYEGYILKYWNDDNLCTSTINTYEYLEEKRRNISVDLVWELYQKYYNLHLENLQKECILMKNIINSISIWEFIQQKYFNNNKELWLKEKDLNI